MSRPVAVSLAAISLIALSGCGAVRGERVLVGEDGASFGADEIAAAPDASAESSNGDEAAPDGTSPAVTVPSPIVEVAEAEPVPAAFAFATTSLSGDAVEGAELLDRAPAVITFVRADCDYSEEEAPKIADAADRHPDVTFVIVASGEEAPDVPWLDGLADGRDNLVLLDDRDDRLWYRFAMTATPSNVLVDETGLMRSSYGALAESGLDRAAAVVVDGFA